MLAKKFYLDEIYIILVRIFQDAVAWVAKQIDQLLIDGLLVRGGVRLVTEIGSVLRGMQSGNLQGYAFLFGVGVILVLYIINAAIG